MATCAVSGNFIDPTGAAFSSVTVISRVISPVISGNSLIAPLETSVISDVSGNFTLTLNQSTSVVFTVQYPVVGTDPMRIVSYTANVPGTATASFNNIIVVEA